MVNFQPQESCQLAAARNETLRMRLGATIERFLSSEITAFEFDELLVEFHGSDDPVVGFVAGTVWYHYDDCDDHLVALSKAEWDYFQRLLLLLKTDCSLEFKQTRSWSGTQFVAAIGLVAFGCFLLLFGWSELLILVCMPLGAVSYWISHVRRRKQDSVAPFAVAVYPFASFGDLEKAYHSVQFSKKKYPREIGRRRIRRFYGESGQKLMLLFVYLIYSPFLLFFQLFPRRTSHTLARMKTQSA